MNCSPRAEMTRSRGCRVAALVLAAVAAPSAAAWPDGLPLQAEPTQVELSGETTAAPPPRSTAALPSTTAQARSASASIISTTLGDLLLAFENASGYNALVASVLGLLMVFRSESAMWFVILAFVAIISYHLGPIEVSRMAHTEIVGATRVTIGVGCGVLGAWVGHRGKHGVLVGIAAIAGFILSQHLEVWLAVAIGPLSEVWTVMLYTVVVAIFVVLVSPCPPTPWPEEDAAGKGLYVHFIFCVFPAIGASLVVSSVSYVATMLLKQKVEGAVFADWTCFLAMLWWPSARDVGLFAGSRYHTELLQREVQLDRVIGFVGWAVLFFAGRSAQGRCPLRCKGAKAGVEEAASGASPGPAGVEEAAKGASPDLAEPLLP